MFPNITHDTVAETPSLREDMISKFQAKLKLKPKLQKYEYTSKPLKEDIFLSNFQAKLKQKLKLQ